MSSPGCGCTDELYGGSECAEHAAETRRQVEQASASYQRHADRQRRERIATAVLGAIWANPARDEQAASRISIPEQAVRLADALIAELDK